MNGLDIIKDRRLKVAIPIIGSSNWMGGVTYLYYLANALSKLDKNKRPEIYLVFRDRQIEDLKYHEYMFHLFDGIIYVGSDDISLPFEFSKCSDYDELAMMTDVYFPVIMDSLPNRCAVSWIPDFQHKYLKEFFHDNELESRESGTNNIVKNKQLVVFSSYDAKYDFLKFYPNSESVCEVMHFYLTPPKEWYADREDILEKYNIPKEYIICCNQFWKHKNHLTLFKAMKELRNQGKDVFLVLTGAKYDYRFPDYYNELMEFLEKNELKASVKILGFIDREEQIYLIRKSIAVVQPSLFEGWGTVLEDCRSLGKTVLLSDIPIHREQQTEFSIFFDSKSETSLSNAIIEVVNNKDGHNSLLREKIALEESMQCVINYAKNFVRIVEKAYYLDSMGKSERN